jgi:hypothetical protein
MRKVASQNSDSVLPAIVTKACRVATGTNNPDAVKCVDAAIESLTLVDDVPLDVRGKAIAVVEEVIEDGEGR